MSARGGATLGRELAEAAQHDVDVAGDGAQRRVDLVGHAGHERAERGHLLRLHEPGLGLAQLRQGLGELGVGLRQLGGALPHALLQRGVDAGVLDGHAGFRRDQLEDFAVPGGERPRRAC